MTAAEAHADLRDRNHPLQATPDAGVALVTISIWNISGDLTKRWLVQAGSSTKKITYRVGDMTPGIKYNILKTGSPPAPLRTPQELLPSRTSAVTTGLVEYIVRLEPAIKNEK